jgi:hypothetical protein
LIASSDIVVNKSELKQFDETLSTKQEYLVKQKEKETETKQKLNELINSKSSVEEKAKQLDEIMKLNQQKLLKIDKELKSSRDVRMTWTF